MKPIKVYSDGVEYEAIYAGMSGPKNHADILKFIGSKLRYGEDGAIEVTNYRGKSLPITMESWVVKSPEGNFSVWSDTLFRKTYVRREPVDKIKEYMAVEPSNLISIQGMTLRLSKIYAITDIAEMYDKRFLEFVIHMEKNTYFTFTSMDTHESRSQLVKDRQMVLKAIENVID